VSGGAKVAVVVPGLVRGGSQIGLWIDDGPVDVTDASIVKYPARGNDQRVALPLYVSP
jgi:hypothetical protein